MSLRFASTLALALGGALVLTSCSRRGEEGDLANAKVISVAVGAEVTLILEDSLCDVPVGDSLVRGCLSSRPEKIESISLTDSGPFDLGESVLDHGTLNVNVKALSAGETTLIVEHTDFFGDKQHDEIHLRAADITHVAANVHCDFGVPDLPTYPITTDTQFYLDLTAMGGETPLASGNLELIEDAAGFNVLGDPGNIRTVMSPGTAGAYTWDLRGKQDLAFAIYNPADLEIGLRNDLDGVHVERMVGGAPICLHNGPAKALIEVTQGACYPLVEDYEIEGKLPVDMRGGDFVLKLAGKGTCEVSAGLDGGKIMSVKTTADDVPDPPKAYNGTVLATAPLSVGGTPNQHGSCPIIKNLTNGTCEIINAAGYIIAPDADCFMDWDWVKDLYAADSEGFVPATASRVGQGLWVELHLGVRYEVFGFGVGIYSTNNLTFSSDPAAGIDISSSGCIESDRQVLAIRPNVAGSFTLNLNADNVYESSTFSLSSAPVTEARFTTEGGDPKSFAGGTQEWWFLGSKTPVKVNYYGSNGLELFGIAPFQVSSDMDGGDATLSGKTIAVGTKPAVIKLESSAAPNAHLIHAVDESAIGMVGGVMPTWLNVGSDFIDDECVQAIPMTGGQAKIGGKSPVRPRVSIDGTAVVVDIQYFAPKGLCLRGYEPGVSNVNVTWGSATAQAAYTVNP